MSDVKPIKIHELKTWPEYFQAIKQGRKKFELRRNDRDFLVGDILRLKEYDPVDEWFGETLDVKISYVLKNCYDFGLRKDFVLLGIRVSETNLESEITRLEANNKQLTETINKQASKIAMLVKANEAGEECRKGQTAVPCHCERLEAMCYVLAEVLEQNAGAMAVMEYNESPEYSKSLESLEDFIEWREWENVQEAFNYIIQGYTVRIKNKQDLMDMTESEAIKRLGKE